MAYRDHHICRTARQIATSPFREDHGSRCRHRSRSRDRSRNRARCHSPPSSAPSCRIRICTSCGEEYDSWSQGCRQRLIEDVVDALKRSDASAARNQPKSILRTGPVPATNGRRTAPDDAHGAAANYGLDGFTQPTFPLTPQPETWPLAAAPADLPRETGGTADILDLLSGVQTGQLNSGLGGGGFDSLMTGGMLNDDYTLRYQPATSQPAQTHPQFANIMTNPPPHPVNLPYSTPAAELQGNPPISPDMQPVLPGFAWTGETWHGPVWTCRLPDTPAPPGTHPPNPIPSNPRVSNASSSHTVIGTGEPPVKPEDKGKRRAPGEPVDLSADLSGDLYSANDTFHGPNSGPRF